MRRKLVVGNWKMNFTLAEALASVEALAKHLAEGHAAEVGIAPPNVLICPLKSHTEPHHIRLGAQDVFWMTKGAFTGRVSAVQLKDAGADFCIIGHSETRGRFGVLEVLATTVPHFSETDQTVNLKLKSLLFAGLTPVVCVGESHAEREAGETDGVIRRQIEGGFEGLLKEELADTVVAYEPVWAIGTGNVCEAEEANRICGFIRSEIARLFGQEAAQAMRILYGGSVKPGNAATLFAQPEIDGGLVGGASLDSNDFAKIVLAAGKAE